MIRVWIDSGLVTHWQISLGVGEPTKFQYMGVIGITNDDFYTWHRHVGESRSVTRGMSMKTFCALYKSFNV